MGIFSSYAEVSGLTEGTTLFNEADLAEEMERLEEMESAQNLSDDPEEACIEAMMIGQENFHNLVMNITNEEVQYMLENSGQEIVYEGTRLDALIDKIRSLVDKAWEKIKAIFEKALAAINSWISTDKRFLQKYSDKIKGASKEALTIRDTYDVDPTSVSKESKIVYTEISDGIGTVVDEFDTIDKESLTKERLIAKVLDGKQTIQEAIGEFEKNCGLREKVAKVELTADTVISELKDGRDNKKSIKYAYDGAKKTVASIKKSVEKRKAAAKKDGNSTDGYSALISAINTGLSTMSSVQRIHIRACNIHHSNCRKAAARAVRGVQNVKESMEIYGGETDFAWLQ